MKRAFIVICSVFVVAAPRLSAQERGAAALGELVDGLGTTARVLMIGAHPDDEDTQLIAYLAKAKHIETAYLSLTRGDGGQNLIGNELGEELGMIRTQELLAARRIDGGRQYFTRAFDFGFSKTLAETEQHWPKDSILEDMVAIVRAYRPQVIISVWSGTPADGHGHHQYAGVLAREVFDAAADSVRFPASRLGGFKPWAVGTFYRLVRGGNGAPLRFNVGEYDPLVGQTYSEIATISRSQHESQGQGGVPLKGPRYSGVRPEVSRVFDVKSAPDGLFAGMDTSWARFKPLALADSVRSAIDSLPAAEAAVKRALDLRDPAADVAPLAAYYRLAARALSGLSCSEFQAIDGRTCAPAEADLKLALQATERRATAALLDAGGVFLEAFGPRELLAESDSMVATVGVYDEGAAPVEFLGADLRAGDPLRVVSRLEYPRPRAVAAGSIAQELVMYHAPGVRSGAWWLRLPRVHDMFTLAPAAAPSDGMRFVSQEMIEGEDRLRSSDAVFRLRIAGVNVRAESAPIFYRAVDPAHGEIRRPIATVPAITVRLAHEIEYARANVPFDRTMLVSLQSASSEPREVSVSLHLPAGLHADSATRRVRLEPDGSATLAFRVQGRLTPGAHDVSAAARLGDSTYTVGYLPITYAHIPPLRYYEPATTRLEAVNATVAGLRVGYIRGVGDNELPMLEELGIPVTELDPATLAQAKLGSYTTIVLGPRAYEANKSLIANNSLLMRFVRDGGTMVVQYGQYLYQQPGILPYPITLARPQADRVTYEDAPVRVIDPGSPLLATPNKITEADFADWVQERSSYMPHTFDAHYRTVFSLNDPGDPPNDAAVLVAPLGRGTYVYTTFSFFRQLPAGNPGAARLFINLLSANQRAATRPPVASGAVKP